MKISINKCASLLLLTCSLQLAAKPVARVYDMKGTVFLKNSRGETSLLKQNSHIEERSEIILEEGALVELTDYYDTNYELAHGTHIKFFDKSIQLKKGKIWVNSLNTRFTTTITTANGVVDFRKSQFIVTYELDKAKSQFFVLNGMINVANILDRDLRVDILAGEFTFIDPDVDAGVPRSGTKIGEKSLAHSMIGFSKSAEPKSLLKSTSRSMASVSETSKGKIIFMTSSREPASVIEKKFKPIPSPIEMVPYTDAKIYYNGESLGSREDFMILPSQSPSAEKRTPASVLTSPSTMTQNEKGDEFQSLMTDLKSF